MGKISDTLLITFGQEPKSYKRNVIPGSESPEEKPVAEMTHEEKIVLRQKVQGDCLECRLVGGGAFIAGGSWFLYNVATKLPKEYQRRPFWYKGYNLFLGVAMMTLGGCRILQLGPFSKDRLEATMKELQKKDEKG